MENIGSALGLVIICSFFMYACEPKETTEMVSETVKAFKCEEPHPMDERK
jgi:hypothetical protein